MKTLAPFFNALFILTLVMIPALQADAKVEPNPEKETILVGRISHIYGQLLRYDPETGDWIAAVKDAPFGVDDLLLSAVGGRAEMIMPNNTWARIDGDTQLQLIALSEDMTEVDVSSGKARLYNKSTETQMKATTPFGYVMAPAQSAFDCYVGATDMEVIALEGTVYFVHNAGGTRHEVIAGSSALSADIAGVAASEGSVPSDWHAWNREREGLWAERMQAKGESGTYLPPGLHDEAYVLEKYGRWENVYYDGAYYHFWRPVHISVGWAPFTVGRWSRWYGDHVWLPHEPFGYLTHHYGNWIFTQGYWYWAPPVTRITVHAGPPLLNVGFCWYPGRVGWIHSGAHVGWIPLAPHEPYYGYRRWGRHAFAVGHKKRAPLHFDIHQYRHRRHAVIIHRNHFYRANPYHRTRIRGISHGRVFDRYRMTPVIHAAVKENYHREIQTRPRFNTAHVRGRPNPAVVTGNRKTRLVSRKRSEFGVNTNRRNQARYNRDGPAVKPGKNTPEGKRGKIGNHPEKNPMPALRLQQKKLRKRKTDRVEIIRQSERRKGPEIVRPRRVREENSRAKVIEIPNRRVRRGEVSTQKIRKKQREPRVKGRTEPRKGPEIVRPQRVREENRNVKVIEIQKRGIRRSEPPASQSRQVRQRPRMEHRAEKRISRTERPMFKRKPDQPSVRAETRGRSQSRGNQTSVFSKPRVNARGYPSGHARTRGGKGRFHR